MLKLYSIIGVAIVSVVFAILLCSHFYCAISNEVTSSVNLVKENVASSGSNLNKPHGNEIEVILIQNGLRKATIIVTNTSSRDVYLPYLPGIADQTAAFVVLGLEKRNGKSERFEKAEQTDFSPGSNTLSPAASFTYKFEVPSPGEYRVNIRYMIDKQWSDRLNASSFLDPSERLHEAEEFDAQIANVVATVTAGPIVL